MQSKQSGHRNRKRENTLIHKHITTVVGLEAPGGCCLIDCVIEMAKLGNKMALSCLVFCFGICLKDFSFFRETHKVSERPGLGAEPVQVGVMRYFLNLFV